MPEVADQPTKPVRTWRPMALWTATIVGVLTLVLAISHLCVSLRRTHQILQKIELPHPQSMYRPEGYFDPECAVQALGGEERAASRVSLYLWWPERVAPYRGRKDKGLAVAVLGNCGGYGIGPLIRALGDQDTRSSAAGALSGIGPAALDHLASALRSPQPEVRQSAANALARIGPAALNHLVSALRSPHPEVRKQVVTILGEMGPQAKPALGALGGLLGDEPAIRRMVVKAAIDIDASAAEPLFWRALEDSDPKTHQDAEAMLNSLASTEASAILHRDSGEGGYMRGLAAMLEKGDVYRRRHAADQLRWAADDESIEIAGMALRRATKDPDQLVRVIATGILGEARFYTGEERFDTEANNGFLLGLLDGPDSTIAVIAGRALMRRGRHRERAFGALVQVLNGKAGLRLVPDAAGGAGAEARRLAARALGELEERRAVEPLIGALGDSDAGVRDEAAGALRALEDPRAVQPLIGALKDSSAPVRWRVVRALGKLKDPRAVEPLIHALQGSDFSVRDCAAEALGKLKDPRAVEPLIGALKDPGCRHEAARALSELKDPRAVEPLIKALKDPSLEFEGGAAEALGKLRDPRAVEPLIGTLTDADHFGRYAAARALGELKDRRAVGPLILALKDYFYGVRQEAAKALGELKDPRAIEPLKVLLADRNNDVRTAAAEALKKIRGEEAPK